MRAKKSEAEKQANAKYMKKYRQRNKDKIDAHVGNPISRMMVCAFISFFNEQRKEFHRSPEYALAFAMVMTNDDAMREAVKKRGPLVKKWLDGDFDKINRRERDARIRLLNNTDEPRKHRIVI